MGYLRISSVAKRWFDVILRSWLKILNIPWGIFGVLFYSRSIKGPLSGPNFPRAGLPPFNIYQSNMRFIILAPILCLLAVVACHPIQHVRSLEVCPLKFLRINFNWNHKKRNEYPTQRDIAPEIQRRSKEDGPTLTWLGLEAVQGNNGFKEAKDEAEEDAKKCWHKNGTYGPKITVTWAQFLLIIDQMTYLYISSVSVMIRLTGGLLA